MKDFLTKLLLLKCIIFLGLSTAVNSQEFKELKFQLASNHAGKISIAIPFEKGKLPLKTIFALESEHGLVDAEMGQHLLWPGTNYIRAISLTFKPKKPLSKYRLFWRNSAFKLKRIIPSSSFVDVTFDGDYLQTIGYGRKTTNLLEYSWFDFGFKQFANYVTNPALISQNPKQRLTYADAAPWLYDHPYTLYMLYLRTGELTWKRLAHEKALKYAKHINSGGYFELKNRPDLKYLMASGLVIDYLFYPSRRTQKIVSKMHKNGLLWHERYQDSLSFWTERNLSNALALAMAEWELNGNIAAKDRVDNLIKGISSSMVRTGKGGCVLHEFRDHEGKGDDSQVCSLWMSALVVEQLWRYIHLTDSLLAKKQIIALGDHALENGLYLGNHKHLDGLVIPMYLYFKEESRYQKNSQWTDMHHACDVVSMILKSQYIKKLSGADYRYGRDKVKGLLKTCKKTLSRSKKVKVWSISPLRKFNWWFSSTANLEWLLMELDY